MNLQELNEIFDTRRREMKKEKISYNFYTNVCNAWNKLNDYLITNNYIYDNDSKNFFLEKMKSIIRKKDYNYYVHAIELIDGIDNLKVTNRINRVIRNDNSIGISDNNSNILEKYLNSRKEYNRDKTLIGKKTITISLMKYFEEMKINDYGKLNIENIIELRNYCLSFELYSSKKRYLWVLRDFLTFLYEEKYVNKNYAFLIDKMQSNTKKLPITWNNEEVEAIVNSLGEDNAIEIRNKAMALLTIRLGIRFIDVKNLKFENINWKENKLKFTQRKTNAYIELPLPEEVGLAIINYIKTARPKTKEKYVFVSHDEYVKQLSDSFNIREYLMNAYEKSGVDYQSKTNKGIHTFRHALATNMLKSGTPLDIISSTLGHLNTNSSKVYISLDDELLKSCCLKMEGIDE